LLLPGPLFRDALDGADDRPCVHPGYSSSTSSPGAAWPPTTTADLPRSVYSTRGQARCSTRMIGSFLPARRRSSTVSRPEPNLPSPRNGLRMPGDQFTPVTSRRDLPLGHQPNAVSITHGTSSVKSESFL